jgi:hypothetical protein
MPRRPDVLSARESAGVGLVLVAAGLLVFSGRPGYGIAIAGALLAVSGIERKN